MRLIAHRARRGADPENSLVGLKGLVPYLEKGLSSIEIDVRVSADGVPVVLHDADLHRTTNGHGEVSATRFAQVQALRLHGTDTSPPSLSEYLQFAAAVLWLSGSPGAATIYIDIKTKVPSEVALVASEIARLPYTRAIVCLGKTLDTFETLHRVGGGTLRLGLLRCNHENLAKNLIIARQYRAEVIFVQQGLDAFLANLDIIPEIRAAGLQVGGSILNGDEALTLARRAGCNLVLTDLP